MASMGLKYLAWAQQATEPDNAVPTYCPPVGDRQDGFANLAIQNAEGRNCTRTTCWSTSARFSSADFTAEVDNIPLADQATLYGATYASDEFKATYNDAPPFGGIGGIQILLVRGVRKYRAWFFPKARVHARLGRATTRGDSISFGTQPIQMKIMTPLYGPWYYLKEFTTEAAAQAYIDTVALRRGTTSTCRCRARPPARARRLSSA